MICYFFVYIIDLEKYSFHFCGLYMVFLCLSGCQKVNFVIFHDKNFKTHLEPMLPPGVKNWQLIYPNWNTAWRHAHIVQAYFALAVSYVCKMFKKSTLIIFCTFNSWLSIWRQDIQHNDIQRNNKSNTTLSITAVLS